MELSSAALLLVLGTALLASGLGRVWAARNLPVTAPAVLQARIAFSERITPLVLSLGSALVLTGLAGMLASVFTV